MKCHNNHNLRINTHWKTYFLRSFARLAVTDNLQIFRIEYHLTVSRKIADRETLTLHDSYGVYASLERSQNVEGKCYAITQNCRNNRATNTYISLISILKISLYRNRILFQWHFWKMFSRNIKYLLWKTKMFLYSFSYFNNKLSSFFRWVSNMYVRNKFKRKFIISVDAFQ